MKGRFIGQAALIGVLGVAVLGSTIALTQRDYSFFDPLIEAKAYISARYVDAPDERALQLGAMRGMIEALGDPNSFYIPPSESREFTKDLTGEYVGIGVSVVVRDSWLTVVSPLEGSPAFRAGIMAEDRIVQIEETSTFGLSPDECVALLTGEPGTKVQIMIERKGERMPITLTREVIVTRTIKGVHRTGRNGEWNHVLDEGRRIGYIRITQFTASTDDEFADALASLGDPTTLGGLIIDVRSNPGGLLTSAVAIADMFLRDGVIVSMKGRAHPEEVARARPQDTLPNFPLIVLIDGQSASASEIVAGALVENERAIAVGTRSFGKGSVQGVQRLPSARGGQLKLTEQRYYLPSGRSIHRVDGATEWGVDPTPGFYVPLTDEEYVAMMMQRREDDIIRGEPTEAGQWADPQWIIERQKDKQLAAALTAMQVKIDRGVWEPTGREPITGDEILSAELRRAEAARERLLDELARVTKRIEDLTVRGVVAEATVDLWPDEVEVAGGRLRVTDREGRHVVDLEITSPDLERWLIRAGVSPVDEPEEP